MGEERMIRSIYNLTVALIIGLVTLFGMLAITVGIPFVVSWAVVSLACLILHAVFSWFYVWALTLALVVLIAMSIEGY